MDIDLLAKMIRDVVLEKDEVALPGLGVFVAEFVPASFSDKGYTINPPYKRLSFRQKDNPDDRTVVRLYAEANKIDEDTAEHFVNDFISGLKDILMVRKSVEFPGLGKLRATKENNIFFVADENLDIYPEGFGLEPVSLKTHQETVSEVAETMAGLRSILEPEPVIEPEVVPESLVEPEAVPGPVIEPEVVPEPDPGTLTLKESGMEFIPETESEAAPEVEALALAETSEELVGEPAEEPGNDIIPPIDIQIEETEPTEDINTLQESGTGVQGDENSENVAQEVLSEILVIEEDADVVGEDANVIEEDNNVVDEDTGVVDESTTDAEMNNIVAEEESQQVEDGTAQADDVMAHPEDDIEDTSGEGEIPAEENRNLVSCSEHSDDGVKTKHGGPGFWKVLRIIAVTIVIVAIIALAAFIILSRVAPDFIDSILYSPEELEIVRKMTSGR